MVGVCQTGRHPLVLAAERPIAAALIWYGAASKREWQVNARYPEPLDELIASVECPVLGMFGEADHVISLDDVRRLRDRLDRHDKSYRIKVYAGAPHGWLNDTMPGRYRRAQAEAGWALQRAFLETRARSRATTARDGCRSTSASTPPTMISPRTCGWSR